MDGFVFQVLFVSAVVVVVSVVVAAVVIVVLAHCCRRLSIHHLHLLSLHTIPVFDRPPFGPSSKTMFVVYKVVFAPLLAKGGSFSSTHIRTHA